ncbi:MAG: hypothetical protein GXP35_13355 [Actinobacteria bacterium]|nr:hypothetical protein [Actinomycetota bacterium]
MGKKLLRALLVFCLAAVATEPALATTPIAVGPQQRVAPSQSELAEPESLWSQEVSFQPARSEVHGADVVDSGRAYDEERGFGWQLADGRRRQCGDRNSELVAIDTFCHASTRYVRTNGAWVAVTSPGSWRFDAEPGVYEVTVTVGESIYHSSRIRHSVQVEGTIAVDRVQTTANEPVVSATVTVEVTDGAVSLDFEGGSRTKIVRVRIERVGGLAQQNPTETTPTTDAANAAQGDASSEPSLTVPVRDQPLIIFEPTAPSSPTLTVPGRPSVVPSAPEQSDVIATYGFDERYGAFASDVAPGTSPHDLFLGYYGPVFEWVDGGVTLSRGAAFATPGPASRAIDAVDDAGEVSIDLWVDVGAPSASEAVIAGLAATGLSYHVVLVRDGSNIELRASSGSITLRAPLSGGALQHVAASVGPSGSKLWIDGKLVAAATGTSVSGPDESRIVVGAYPDSSGSWSGQIDHFEIRASQLTTATVQTLAESNRDVICVAPTAVERGPRSDDLGRSYVGVFQSESDLTESLADAVVSRPDAVRDVLRHANAMLCQQPSSVTANGGGSAWLTDSPYSSDGIFELSADRHDYRLGERLSRGLPALGIAYRITGDEAYAEQALQLLDAWALDPQSRLAPELSPNRRDIEIYITQTGVLYGADLIWDYTGWTPDQRTALIDWASDLGDAVRTTSTSNNTDSWRLLLLATAGRMGARPDHVEAAVVRFTQRLDAQIGPDGTMLRETHRTRSLFYAVFGVAAMVQLAEVSAMSGFDIYALTGDDGQAIKTAIDHLAPFLAQDDPTDGWPDTEIGPLYAGDLLVGVFAIIQRRFPSTDYGPVVARWGSPMFARVGAGHVSVTHGGPNS